MSARYEHQGLSFVPAPEWLDRTVVSFVTPPLPGAHHAAFVVTREALREGDTLRTHAERMLMESARAERDFELLSSRETTLAEHPAVSVRARVKTRVGILEQTMTIVATTFAGRTMVTTFTATAPVDRAKALHPVFEEMLRSVRLDGSAPPGAVSPSEPPSSDSYPVASPHTAPPELVPMPGTRRR